VTVILVRDLVEDLAVAALECSVRHPSNVGRVPDDRDVLGLVLVPKHGQRQGLKSPQYNPLVFPFDRDSTAISPTAHYTGQVWVRNGLSHPQLTTLQGRWMFESLQPLMTVSGLVGGPTIEHYLLARHRALDGLLRQAIEEDGVTQVIEIACGMSARGWRFTQRYGDALTYVEADLPAMAARKRDALYRIEPFGLHHRVRDVDALAISGPSSLAALAGELDPAGGLVIMCEGLLSYLPGDAVLGLWERMAAVLSGFPVGVHLTDLFLRGTGPQPLVEGFRLGLGLFVRGRAHRHFTDQSDAVAAVLGAGFASAQVPRSDSLSGGSKGSGRLSHVLRARAYSASTASG
jgi:O-methyltransferase involved in polyketide biosynthesis